MLEAVKAYTLKHKDLRLERINSDNVFDIADLTIADDQADFVAPNQESMALAFGYIMEGKYVEAFGIYDGETPVGFMMIGHNTVYFDDCPTVYGHSYNLWRMMIDKNLQGRGYGKDATKLIIDYILTFPDGEEELLSAAYDEGNAASKNMLLAFGFEPNGETAGPEIMTTLKLK